MPPLLHAENLRRAGIPHAFTTRQGGISRGPYASLNLGRGVDDDPAAVAHNRAAVLATLGFDHAGHVEAAQVHGAVVAVVSPSDAGTVIGGADGLATAEPGLVLAVHAADCVPLLIADPRRPAVAAVHAGWRGTAAGIAVEAVTVLADRFGSRPEDLLVALGPAIGPCHYEVDEPVIERLRLWPWWEEVTTSNARGRWQLDLRAANRRQLVDAGVLPERIETLDLCTYDHPEMFFSYRRDRITGRMAGLVALPAGGKAPRASNTPTV
jgi:purine-nucleoside/S-methyl-5'-thioadenosine phosphorylase / adenosine deaminase